MSFCKEEIRWHQWRIMTSLDALLVGCFIGRVALLEKCFAPTPMTSFLPKQQTTATRVASKMDFYMPSPSNGRCNLFGRVGLLDCGNICPIPFFCCLVSHFDSLPRVENRSLHIIYCRNVHSLLYWRFPRRFIFIHALLSLILQPTIPGSYPAFEMRLWHLLLLLLLFSLHSLLLLLFLRL